MKISKYIILFGILLESSILLSLNNISCQAIDITVENQASYSFPYWITYQNSNENLHGIIEPGPKTFAGSITAVIICGSPDSNCMQCAYTKNGTMIINKDSSPNTPPDLTCAETESSGKNSSQQKIELKPKPVY
jgi:hypothetical protein